MKLWEFAKETYLSEGNVPCRINVETESIKDEFGYSYEGQKVKYGGLDGRIADVPAFIGDCEIKFIDSHNNLFTGTTYEVWI